MLRFDKFENYWITKANVRINTVNCVGIMGKGIALDFKTRYPDMFKEYVKVCKNNELKPGLLHIYKCDVFDDCDYIVNFATKDHWRNPSKTEWIDRGLAQLKEWILKNCNTETQVIGLPALGCGNGGLFWGEIKEKINSVFRNNDIICHVVVFEPKGYTL